MRTGLALVFALGLSLTPVGAAPAPRTKAPREPKAPKTTAKDLVEGEASMPSPIQPLKAASPSEMAARFFVEALRPFGEWVDLDGYGQCWKPSGVGELWAPYTVGSWAYSRHGWTWVSEEDFGGIVYHYGRWLRSIEDGWCWVPDLEWAASWVAWRYGTDTIGWAPLPPNAKWNPETGIGIWADRDYEIGPGNYAFCLMSDFGSPDVSKVLFSAARKVEGFRRSVSVTNISALGKGIFCGGPAFNWVASRASDPIDVIRVIKERSLVKFREQLNEVAEAQSSGRPSFRGVLQEEKLTVVAPEWGVLADPRRADALGFSVEASDAPKNLKFTELSPEEAAKKDGVKADATPLQKPVMLVTGWENLRDDLRKSLKSKVSKEVGGLNPGNTPAVRFDPERDLPLVAR